MSEEGGIKYRTFTVLFVEEYDPANGVVMNDEQARDEFVGKMQDCYDEGDAPGTNFLVVKIEDGHDRFWQTWKEHAEAGRKAGLS
jgi:hypothetical protein